MFGLLGAIFGGLVVAEVFSLLLAMATIRYLRENMSSFSAQTYRMHLQLIILLVIQVGQTIPAISRDLSHQRYSARPAASPDGAATGLLLLPTLVLDAGKEILHCRLYKRRY